MGGDVDVHQHLWPEGLVELLRGRTRPPYLRGWTLTTGTEAPYDVPPTDHDVAARVATDEAVGIGLACVSLSSPLGIESLPPAEADDLLAAWHEGVRRLPAHFAGWASVASTEPDVDALRDQLEDGFVGLQLPASRLTTPAGWTAAGDVLRVAELADAPVLVHPGPAAAAGERLPEWWAPVVAYTSQLQAAWWAWHAADGRGQFPALRLVFAAGAGLAPVQHERYAARGGVRDVVDPNVFVDTSSYGVQGLDPLVRALGIDALVHGSDAPYAGPLTSYGGEAALHAIRSTNPRRALHGAAPGPEGDLRGHQ